jgi:DNA-binding IclR family transcriptional regulator
MASTPCLPATVATSSRHRTHLQGSFIRDTAGSQSLERGLQLLRAFRLGATVLGNAELAARTGLPRPTVSRLTRSLVDAGFLAYDLQHKAYRLTAVFLSLALVYRRELPLLDVALPLMRKLACSEQINVGLAVAEQQDMVYLESIREQQRFFRNVSSGSRIPIEQTSLGRAALYALGKQARDDMLAAIAPRYGRGWTAMRAEIRRSLADIAKNGYCHSSWQAGMVALAAPLVLPDGAAHALNISFAWADGDSLPLVRRYGPLLLSLAEDIQLAYEKEVRATPLA